MERVSDSILGSIFGVVFIGIMVLVAAYMLDSLMLATGRAFRMEAEEGYWIWGAGVAAIAVFYPEVAGALVMLFAGLMALFGTVVWLLSMSSCVSFQTPDALVRIWIVVFGSLAAFGVILVYAMGRGYVLGMRAGGLSIQESAVRSLRDVRRRLNPKSWKA